MKKALCIVAGLLVCILTGYAKIEKPVPVQGSRSVATAPQTRAGATAYETLPDPYALENMQAVYNFCGVNTTLQATDLYVRFLWQLGNPCFYS